MNFTHFPHGISLTGEKTSGGFQQSTTKATDLFENFFNKTVGVMEDKR